MKLLDDLLKAALRESYPHVAISSDELFLPLVELHRGHVSSRAPLKVASETRGNANAIAEMLLTRMAEGFPLHLHAEGGYLVARAEPASMLSSFVPTWSEVVNRDSKSADTGSPTVVAALETSDVPMYARLRIQSIAALQAWLTVCLRGKCRVALKPGAAVVVSDLESFAAEVSKGVAWCLATPTPIRAAPEAAIQDRANASALWAAHHHLDALGQNESGRAQKLSLDTLREASRLTIRMPNDGWLLSRERILPELLLPKAFEKVAARVTAPQHWLRWVFHLASPVASGSFDPGIALFDEYSSPWYGARAVVERVTRAGFSASKEVAESVNSSEGRLKFLEESGEVERCVARGYILPAAAEAAVERMEVPAWSAILGDFVASAHRLLNAPEFRNSQNYAISEQIVASLTFGLAGILPLLAEDSWPD